MRPGGLAAGRPSAAPPRGWGDIIPGGRSNPRKEKIHAKKKAAGFPQRPFLSYGSSTLTGDYRTSAPGAYLPAVSYSVAAANRDSRELEPEPTRWSPISVRWPIEP